MADAQVTVYIGAIRSELADLIQIKEDLLEPEVLKVSMMLDDVLNNYYRLKCKGFVH